jgi:hypothetical protein
VAGPSGVMTSLPIRGDAEDEELPINDDEIKTLLED